MDMIKVTAKWSGFQGAPGYSNFFFGYTGGIIDGGLLGDAVTSAVNHTRDALGQATTALPNSVSITFDSECPIIESETGTIVGYGTVDGEVAAVNGIAAGSYSGPSGGVVNWRTSDLRFGRRIRGRTFMVPLSLDAYESDGTLTSTALGSLRGFAAAMIGGPLGTDFGVWSRPRGGTGGVFATVDSYNVPDMAAVLRSRRD